MQARGLTNLLKINHGFGFGPLRIDEKIGDFFVEDILIDKNHIYYHLRNRSSWAPKKIARIRGNWMHNLVDHFLVRCDLKNNYLGQPIYTEEQTQYDQRVEEEYTKRVYPSQEEDEGDGWLEIRWRD